MNWAEIKQYMENFRSDQVMQQLQDWNITDLNSNPWFLGAFAAIILITYFIGWRAIAGFISGVGGFALVLSFAFDKGTGVEGIASGGLWILVGGGVVVVFLFIYLLFIKAE